MCLFYTQCCRISRDCLIGLSGKIGELELKLHFCRPQSSKGVVAAPNILMYYLHAADLNKILQCWNAASKFSWDTESFEQVDPQMPLTEVTLNLKEFKTKILGCVALLWTWRKYLDLVAPGQSPIASFSCSSKFWLPIIGSENTDSVSFNRTETGDRLRKVDETKHRRFWGFWVPVQGSVQFN